MDLREHLKVLEERSLFRWVETEVDKDTELSAIVRCLFRGLPQEKRFGVGFRRVRGFDIPVVVGALAASKYVVATVMQTEPNPLAIHSRWAEALANPVPAEIVRDGPCQEVVLRGKDVDLRKFPSPTWLPEKDSGCFFTPLWVTKDPETRGRNVGMYRAEVKATNKTGIYYANVDQQGYVHQVKHEALGEPMEAAFFVGGDPVIYTAGVAKCPPGIDEFAVAGGLRGAPIELVKCKTVDVEVPATAEIVVEGEFRPGERESEGPFGEWTGYMAGSPFGMPVFHVTCITHRRQPLLQGVLSQMPPSESSGLRQMLFEGLVLKHLRNDLKIDGIVDVHMPETVGCNGMLWIAMRNSYPGKPFHVAMAAIGRLGPAWTKWVVVVDEDIDIRDAQSREWVLNFRVRPEHDIHITPVTMSLLMDPSAGEDIPLHERRAAKVFVDATKKTAYPRIALPPKAYLDKVQDRWHAYGLPEVDFAWIKGLRE